MVKGIEAFELAQLGFNQNWASIAQQGPHARQTDKNASSEGIVMRARAPGLLQANPC